MWKEPFLARLRERGYVPRAAGCYALPRVESGAQDNPYPDIDYGARMADPMSTTAGEWPYYAAGIDYAMKLLPGQAVVLDLGCGDGRMTLELLRVSDIRVISVDIDYANLVRVAQRIPEAQKSRWLGWVDDARMLDLPAESLDAFFVMGLLHVLLPDTPAMLHSLCSSLRSGGLLIDSEATVEGALLYAIARHSSNEFQQVALTQTKTVDFDSPTAPRVPVVSPNQMQSILEEAGFEVLKRMPVSVLPSLVYGGWFREESISEAERAEIHRLVSGISQSEVNASRVVIFISRKP